MFRLLDSSDSEHGARRERRAKRRCARDRAPAGPLPWFGCASLAMMKSEDYFPKSPAIFSSIAVTPLEP
jgi:hypothetical protein